MASDTCYFCAGGIIILLGMMAPLGFHVLSSGEGSFVLHWDCQLPGVFLLCCSGKLLLLMQLCFLVWYFLSTSGYCCSGRDPALLILLEPWHGHGEQCWGASCVLVPKQWPGLSAMRESLCTGLAQQYLQDWPGPAALFYLWFQILVPSLAVSVDLN